MLEQITPIILSYNEAPNIGRALRQLRWARDIVLLDSFSEDETLEIAAGFPNVRVYQRVFDSHAAQWNFCLKETGVESPWVLALDADYVLTSALVSELGSLEPEANTAGYEASFTYCIGGRGLRSGVYPPVTVLYRRPMGDYAQDGHTHRLVLNGETKKLQARILHDDRKSFRRWFHSQRRYMALEAEKVRNDTAGSGRMSKIRKLRVVAPPAVLLYCLILRGGLLDGRRGIYYAFQRTLAELLLSLYLIERDLRALTGRQERSLQTEDQRKDEKDVESGKHEAAVKV